MFHERSLSQLKVVELNKYIAHHNLGKYGTKKAKLEAIKENIIQELAKRTEKEEDGKSDNQSSSDSLRSESEDDSERKKTLKRKRSRLRKKKGLRAPRTLMLIRQLSTHGLGEEQLESKFKVALNRMSMSWTW